MFDLFDLSWVGLLACFAAAVLAAYLALYGAVPRLPGWSLLPLSVLLAPLLLAVVAVAAVTQHGALNEFGGSPSDPHGRTPMAQTERTGERTVERTGRATTLEGTGPDGAPETTSETTQSRTTGSASPGASPSASPSASATASSSATASPTASPAAGESR